MNDARRRRKGRAHDDHVDRRRSRRGRGKRRLLLLLILLGAVVALLPTIVVKTPLRDVLLAQLLPADALRVTIGDASLGWFTPLSAGRISVRDSSGGELFALESLRLDRSLWSLVTHPRDLGTLEIARPRLRVEVRPDGSSLEDAIGQLAARFGSHDQESPPQNKAASPTAIAVRVTDGTILVVDRASKREWRAHAVQLQFDSAAEAKTPPRFSLTGELFPCPGRRRWASRQATTHLADRRRVVGVGQPVAAPDDGRRGGDGHPRIKRHGNLERRRRAKQPTAQ
jgi:hypothetical protein